MNEYIQKTFNVLNIQCEKETEVPAIDACSFGPIKKFDRTFFKFQEQQTEFQNISYPVHELKDCSRLSYVFYNVNILYTF